MVRLLFNDSVPNGFMELRLFYEEEKTGIGIPASFTGKKLETIFLPEKNLFIGGLGKKEEFNIDYLRRLAGRAVKTASACKIEGIHLSPRHLDEKQCLCLLEGSFLANYAFDKYKSKDDKRFLLNSISFPANAKQFHGAMEQAMVVCENVFIVRDLVSDNSSEVTPVLLERFSRKVAKKLGLKIRVLDEKGMKKLGLNLILGVSGASNAPPRLICIEYCGNKKSDEKIVLIGKGITFDSGGLNIKIGESIKNMRMDMAGAATVLGIIKSVAELKLRQNIVSVLVCAENLVDSKSQRPGDVIVSYSGKTVENLNCDAEGRLILADAISYSVKKYSPKLVVEFSTLTGAVLGTFGQHCAAMISTSDEYAKKMAESGFETYERVWQLPLFEEYSDEVKGERADFRSVSKNRYNGTIFGGAFLSKFCEGVPFVHVDVAGTAMIDEAKDYVPKDGTGFGVRLGIEFLKKNGSK